MRREEGGGRVRGSEREGRGLSENSGIKFYNLLIDLFARSRESRLIMLLLCDKIVSFILEMSALCTVQYLIIRINKNK